jgi:ABC transporter substrate binding protein (PQQ-dependent alcohol dehydrogenase system)
MTERKPLFMRSSRRLSALLFLAFAALLAAGAQAATLTLGVVSRADDERLDDKRVELGYLGHPGGPLTQAAEMAIEETRFELEAANVQAKLEPIEVRDANEARAALQKLEKAGASAAILDLPAAWIASAAGAVKLPLLNAGEAADSLRAACTPHLFHTLPSERMRADALAQALMARRWTRVLVLHGPSEQDKSRLAVAQASIKRYALKPVAVKQFKLSADPRERDLANPLLLTGGLDYDVLWVVDSDAEFARSLPYRTALPRPVVGDGGLVALAWAPNFERFGAPQLARRFMRSAKRPMTAPDWAAWIATKAVLQAALIQPATPNAAQVQKALTREDFTLDGFKGTRLSFRPWNRQLRQPLLLTDGQGVIGTAPAEGVLHPKNILDTLGVDAPESPCKPAS